MAGRDWRGARVAGAALIGLVCWLVAGAGRLAAGEGAGAPNAAPGAAVTTAAGAPGAPAGARRVASLSPNLTEIVFCLGRGERLVGRSSACDYPPEAARVPVVGDFAKPFLEPLLLARPDLVVTTRPADPAIPGALARHGIRCLVLPDDCLADYPAALRALGRELDCAAAAEREAARLAAALAPAGGALPPAPRPRVLMLFSLRPYVTVGRRGFVNELLAAAGAENLAGGEAQGYFTCSLEWVLSARPDVIVIPKMGGMDVAGLLAAPGWRDLPAVRQGRVYADCDPDWLCRLGPRLALGAEWLREKLNAPGAGAASESGKNDKKDE